MKIDMVSILKKVDEACENKENRKKGLATLYNLIKRGESGIKRQFEGTPAAAFEDLKDCLRNAIESSGISSSLQGKFIDAVEGEIYYDLTTIGADKVEVPMTVSITGGDLSSPSLVPEGQIYKHRDGSDSNFGGYPPINNLADLFNNGVDHVMKQVWGERDGEFMGSETVINGAHFIEAAVDSFKQYGYDIIDIYAHSTWESVDDI